MHIRKQTNLGITIERFKFIYGDRFIALSGEELPSIFTTEPNSEQEFVSEYLTSKLWRLNHLYYIIDKAGKKGILKMNKAQHMLHNALFDRARQIALKSRQQGISTYSDTTFFDDAMTIPNLNVGLTSQGNEESTKLLDRTKLKWEELDPFVKKKLGVQREKSNKLEFAFSNYSTIFIRQSFASTTLQRLWISEYGKIAESKPAVARELQVGTMQAIHYEHPIIIESTARGDNRFKTIWDTAIDYKGPKAPKDFNPFFLSWVEDEDCNIDYEQTITAEAERAFANIEYELSQIKDGYHCSCKPDNYSIHCKRDTCNRFKLTDTQKWWWVQQYRELGEDIYQEYPAYPEQAFDSSQKGTYYMELFKEHVVSNNRIVKGLYDPQYSVNIAIDLGIDDDMSFIYYQEFTDTNGIYHVNIVFEEIGNERPLVDYMMTAKIKKDSGWKIRKLVFPHDAAKRDYELTSVIDLAMKINQQIELYALISKLEIDSLLGGIQAVKSVIKYISVDISCVHTLGMFRNYKKEFDHNAGVYKSLPKHDKYSHTADAIRYMTGNLNIPTYAKSKNALQGPKQFNLFPDNFNTLGDTR